MESASRSTRTPESHARPLVPWCGGDVVTVEPGVYLAGVGGVRIEDTVVVGAEGAEALTRTSKDLVL